MENMMVTDSYDEWKEQIKQLFGYICDFPEEGVFTKFMIAPTAIVGGMPIMAKSAKIEDGSGYSEFADKRLFVIIKDESGTIIRYSDI